MQAAVRLSKGQRFSIAEDVTLDILTESVAENRLTAALGNIDPAAGARMIRMGVGNHGSRHRPPGVDVEIACGAVQAAICQLNQGQSSIR